MCPINLGLLLRFRWSACPVDDSVPVGTGKNCMIYTFLSRRERVSSGTSQKAQESLIANRAAMALRERSTLAEHSIKLLHIKRCAGPVNSSMRHFDFHIQIAKALLGSRFQLSLGLSPKSRKSKQTGHTVSEGVGIFQSRLVRWGVKEKK
ncbi:hypothetical protein NDU88_003357 [Pleurodeles waltl]|uniref:Uncharacterized protein n=1 Tax=Pleurodeles waltl TaxID=8319 RepID=A0AAV7MS76_PLEWA|nr:hypothetical protein NDU88_003357 [Pleurodeles waltl]